jgi:hypothetical protein
VEWNINPDSIPGMDDPEPGRWVERIMRILLLTLLVLTGAGAAQEAVPVPPELVSVVSGGFWEDGGESGFCRVRVYREGWEHVYGLVFLDWIREDPDSGLLVYAASTGVGEIGDEAVWSLATPGVEFQGDAAVIGIEGTHTCTGESRVTMTAPGHHEVVQDLVNNPTDGFCQTQTQRMIPWKSSCISWRRNSSGRSSISSASARRESRVILPREPTSRGM